MRIDRPATPEEAVAIAAVVAAVLASERASASQEAVPPGRNPWRMAGRLEHLGLARRIDAPADLGAWCRVASERPLR